MYPNTRSSNWKDSLWLNPAPPNAPAVSSRNPGNSAGAVSPVIPGPRAAWKRTDSVPAVTPTPTPNANQVGLSAAEANKPSPYTSNYASQINALLAQSNPGYQSQYQNQINNLLNQGAPQYNSQYQAMIDNMLQSGSPTYDSRYGGQIDDMLNQILGRKKFEYNMNADPLYQQYKNQYMQLGNQAMRDTMGNAAGLTGGYGSSYASTAGNQAYQGYLGQLNSIAPQLYESALNAYDRQGQRQLENLAMLQSAEGQDYSKYRDTVGDYNNRLAQYQGAESMDYSKYRDTAGDYNNLLAQYQNLENAAYGQYRDTVSDRYNDLNAYQNLENMAFNQYQGLYGNYADDRDYWYKKYYDNRALNQTRAQSNGGSVKTPR